MKYTSRLILNGQTYNFGEAPWRDKDTTFCYFPFTGNTNDKTGNVASVENHGVIVGPYQGVDCAEFNNSAYLNGYNIQRGIDTTKSTFLCWCYNTGVNTIDGKIIDFRNSGLNYCRGYCEDVNNPGYFMSYNVGGRYDSLYIGTAQQNERILFYTTTDGSNVKVGTIDLSGNRIEQTASNHAPQSFDAYQFNMYFGIENGSPNYRDYIGGMSELYIDLSTWSTADIVAYFDETKARYGAV